MTKRLIFYIIICKISNVARSRLGKSKVSMKKTEIKKYIAIAIDIINILLVGLSVLSFFEDGGNGNIVVKDALCFGRFTNDSNILMAITSLIPLVFLFKSEVPEVVVVLKFVGTVAVTVTLLTVLLFLGPTHGYDGMFDGVFLYLHLICPLLSIISLYLPETPKPLPKFAWLYGTLPVVVYGSVYLIMVLITEKWPDFYGFNRGGFWYISLPAMFLCNALLSFIMAFIRKFRIKSKGNFDE